MKKKISILCSNLSNNALGRSYLLGSLLNDDFSVEIMGPLYADQEIWAPLRHNTTVSITPFRISRPPESYHQIKELYRKIDGDIIYANKTYFISVGLGFLKKVRDKVPLVVDIDDWDLGFALYRFRNMCLKDKVKNSFGWMTQLPRCYESNRAASMFFYQRLARFADAITVSNTFLQRRFGGHLIPHVRDTSVLCPQRYDHVKLREKYKISSHTKIISFIGTPRVFKGIEDLVEAVLMVDDPDLSLMIVGADPEYHYTKTIESKAAALKKQGRLIMIEQQPFAALPEFLAMSDIIAIPQRKCIATVGQIPAKVFDAMAMEKAIVATAVSDLPEILKDCGWIAEPNNPKDLAHAIREILSQNEDVAEKKKNARIKCISHYSTDKYKQILVSLLDHVNKGYRYASEV